MKIVSFNEHPAGLLPAVPCNAVDPLYLTITYEFVTVCPGTAYNIITSEEVCGAPYPFTFLATPEATAADYAAEVYGPEFSYVTKVIGNTVTFAVTWQWLVETGVFATQLEARAYLQGICALEELTACFAPGGSCDPEIIVTIDCCTPVLLTYRCDALRTQTARVIFDVGFSFALPAINTVRQIRLGGSPCRIEDGCDDLDWGSAEVVTVGNNEMEAAIQDLAGIYNDQFSARAAVRISATAIGSIFTVDFDFDEPETFAFFCDNCLKNMQLCVRDDYSLFGGPALIGYNRYLPADSYCGCLPAVLCGPLETYCLPIQPADIVAMPIDLKDTEFAAGIYTVDLCKENEVVEANIGTLSVNAHKYGYLDVRIPPSLSNGCYSYCIRAISWRALPSPDVCCDNACAKSWEVDGSICVWLQTYMQLLETVYLNTGQFPPAAHLEDLTLIPPIGSGCYTNGVYDRNFYFGGSIVSSVFVSFTPTSDCGHTYTVTLYVSNNDNSVLFQGQIARGIAAGDVPPEIPSYAYLSPGPGFAALSDGCAYDCSSASGNIFPYGDRGTFEAAGTGTLGIRAQAHGATNSRSTAFARTGIASLRVLSDLSGSAVPAFEHAGVPLAANRSYLLEYWAYTTVANVTGSTFQTTGVDPPAAWEFSAETLWAISGVIIPLDKWVRFAVRVDTKLTAGVLFAAPGFVCSDGQAVVYFDDIAVFDVTPPAAPTARHLSKEYVSSCLNVGSICDTIEIRATNNGSGLGIPYASLAGNQTRFRVGAILRNPQSTAEREIYVDSAGRHIKIWSQLERQVDLETDYLTDEIHSGIAMCLEHDKVELRPGGDLQFVEYSAFEDYKRTDIKQRPEYGLRKAVAKLKQTPYLKINDFC